jgi:GNAT superfamily N-acetyltransferase
LRRPIAVHPKTEQDQAWVEALLIERWGGVQVVLHGALHDAHHLPALVAGERQGLATYHFGPPATLVTLDAVTPRQGTATALVEALTGLLRRQGVDTLAVTTTNDNLDALRFYQRRGFRIVDLRPGAITDARQLKPAISEIGAYGIPIRDEIDLELDLS